MLASMDGIADVIRRSMAHTTRATHGTVAEISRIIGLAATRLDQVDPDGKFVLRDLAAVKKMLRDAEDMAHAEYLKRHGSEDDYQAIGAKVEKRYRTPSGKWRA